MAEARYGLYVDRLELSSAPGGEGRRRGGKGILLEYRVRGDGCFLTCAYTRSVHPPWGQAAGCDGSPNFVEVVRADGGVERFAVVTTLPLNAGRRDPHPHGQRRRLRPRPSASRSASSRTRATVSSPTGCIRA